jgi:hypothetical protein
MWQNHGRCFDRIIFDQLLNVVKLVDSVISDLSKDHRENFHVVRLNGFIHTDDKLALKEIWRQLGREMDAEDEMTGKVIP